MAKVDNLKHNQIYQRVMPVHELCKNRAKGEAHQILPEVFFTYQGGYILLINTIVLGVNTRIEFWGKLFKNP